MKNYDEFAEIVFREADRRLVRKRKRAAAVRRYTLAFAGMFAVFLTGIFVIKNETARQALEKKFNDRYIITDESRITKDPDVTTLPEYIVTSSDGAEYYTTASAVSDTDETRETSVRTTSPAKTSETSSASQTAAVSSTSARTSASQHYADITTPPAVSTDEYVKTSTMTKIPVTTLKTTSRRTTQTVSSETVVTVSATFTAAPPTTMKPMPTTTSSVTTVRPITTTPPPIPTSPVSTTSTRTTIITTVTSNTKITTTTITTTMRTTATLQTTVTVTTYPDIELPPETADPSGNTTVPVTYRYSAELYDVIPGDLIGETVIDTGGMLYECDVYIFSGSDPLNSVLLYVRNNDKWLLYEAKMLE